MARRFQFKPTVIFFMALVCSSAFALDLSDFEPNFLTKHHQESPTFNDAAPIKPIVDVKRNTNSSGTWYCNDDANGANNVFCNHNNSTSDNSKVAASTSKQATPMAAENVTTTDNHATPADNNLTSSNQTAMQTQQARTLIDQYQDQLKVPIKTGKNVDVDINSQQIQLKIKY